MSLLSTLELLRKFLPARKQGYRPDVDGLRALAVLVILAFHLDVSGFSGGFAGVDIFFVISGYVILRRTLPDINNGIFSIKAFYERRVRRIAPGLIATLFTTLAIGVYLLPPAAFDELGGSALASLVFGPNFFFHDRSGYFAGAAYEKPLLHMWSLGIEEQFYLFLPLLLLGFTKCKKAKPEIVLAIVTALSLIYCLISTPISPNHAFYMPMARLWEIGLGGLVSVAEARRKPPAREAHLYSALGLLLIILSVVSFDSDIAFPGWAALIPALGSTFIILGGSSTSPLVNRALALKPIVAIGAASYALYLVHWPLIVFSRLWLSRPLLAQEKAGLAVITVSISFALWQFVEKPFRKGDQEWPIAHVLKGLGITTSIVALIASFAVLSDGWPSRMSAEALQVKALLDEAKKAEPSCAKQTTLFPGIHKKQQVCLYGSPDTIKNAVVLWGDSHAGVFAPSLAKALSSKGRSLLWISLPDCAPLRGIEVSHRKSPEACTALVNHTMAFLRTRRGGTVVIAGRWANLGSPIKAPGDGEEPRRLFDLENHQTPITFQAALHRTLGDLSEAGTKIVLIGPIPEIDYDVPNALMRANNGIGRVPEVNRASFDLRQNEVFNSIQEVANLPGVSIVYPHQTLCTAHRCEVNEGTRSLYTDDDHLSAFGVDRVLPYVLSKIDGTFNR